MELSPYEIYILELIEAAGGELSTRGVADALDKNEPAARWWLRRLAAKGYLLRVFGPDLSQPARWQLRAGSWQADRDT